MPEEKQEILEAQKCLFEMEIKAVDEEKYTAEVVISSGNRDRMGDVVEPEAVIAGAKNFMKHPILLDSHDRHGGVEKIIGKFLELSVKDNKVVAKVQYLAKQGNSAADWAFNLAKQGIAAFSIGFRGLAYEYIEEKDSDGYKRITGYKFTKIELLEVSQVAIPANADALMKAYTEFSKSKVAQVPKTSEEKPQEKQYAGTELLAKFAEFLKSETKEN